MANESQVTGTIWVDPSAGANRLSFPTFETSIAEWESNTAFGTYQQATLSQSSTQAHGGTFSLKATWPGVKKSIVNVFGFTTVVGSVYKLDGWVYVPAGSSDIRATDIWTVSSLPIATKNTWVRSVFSTVATGTTTWFGWETTSISVGSLYVDDVSITSWPSGLLVDGATVPVPYSVLNGATYVNNDRVNATVRNPLPPIVLGKETGAF